MTSPHENRLGQNSTGIIAVNIWERLGLDLISVNSLCGVR
jgi:hypothetical protein